MPGIEMTPLVVMGATMIDIVAVAALAWLLARGQRERTVVLDDQRTALEGLRGDLGRLLEEAERRAQRLERTLAARERSLRAVVRSLERTETRGAEGSQDPPPPVKPLTRDTVVLSEEDVDPAEARLLRDLEVSLEGGRRG